MRRIRVAVNPAVHHAGRRGARRARPEDAGSGSRALGDRSGAVRVASARPLWRGVTLGEGSVAQPITREALGETGGGRLAPIAALIPARAPMQEVRRRETSRIASLGARRAVLGLRGAPMQEVRRRETSRIASLGTRGAAAGTRRDALAAPRAALGARREAHVSRGAPMQEVPRRRSSRIASPVTPRAAPGS